MPGTRALVIFGDKFGFGTQSVVVCNEHSTHFLDCKSDGDVAVYEADSDIPCEFCRVVDPLD